MKQTKLTLERFTFCDHIAIQERLEDMALQGWMVEKPGNLLWRFRRIKPQKLHFAVTYFPGASDFDPGPTDGQKMFEELSTAQGWVLACQWGQMQIFYNREENPTPIDTDPVTQVDTIYRSMKKNVLPAHFFLLALCVYQLVFMSWQLHSKPVEFLSRPSSLYMFLMWTLLSLSTILEIGIYIHWHHKAKLAADSGVFYSTKLNHTASWVLLGIALLVIALNIISIASWWWAAAIWICVMTFCGFSVRMLRNHLRKKGVSRTVNRTVSIGAAMILSMAFMIIMGVIIIRGGLPGGRAPVATYDKGGWEMNVYDDEIPLDMEDMIDVPITDWSREQQRNTTFLLNSTDYNQWPLTEDRTIPSLKYTVTEFSTPFLYELCKNALLDAKQDEYFDDGEVFTNHYEPVDAELWGAAEAYQLHWSSSVLNEYLLCYETRLIEISFDWEPTPEQMIVVAEKLGE